MTPNHKLTNVIKGRIVQDLQMSATEVSMRFSDGSTMHVKVMESNSPPLKNGARLADIEFNLKKLREEITNAYISWEGKIVLEQSPKQPPAQPKKKAVT
jgi:hypothetical protein